MIAPTLLAGVKQRDSLTGEGVFSVGRAAFVLVATAAGKAKIIESRFAPLGLWPNMIHSHGLAGVGFRRRAIGAMAIVGFEQPLAQVGGEIAHPLQFSSGGDLMTAPLQ